MVYLVKYHENSDAECISRVYAAKELAAAQKFMETSYQAMLNSIGIDKDSADDADHEHYNDGANAYILDGIDDYSWSIKTLDASTLTDGAVIEL